MFSSSDTSSLCLSNFVFLLRLVQVSRMRWTLLLALKIFKKEVIDVLVSLMCFKPIYVGLSMCFRGENVKLPMCYLHKDQDRERFLDLILSMQVSNMRYMSIDASGQKDDNSFFIILKMNFNT